MTFGDRVKKIRVFRKMTMEEFGAALGFEGRNRYGHKSFAALGFEGRNRSVRANQYESGNVIPSVICL